MKNMNSNKSSKALGFFFKNIKIHNIKMKFRIITKICCRFNDILSDFTAFGLHRDRLPPWKLKKITDPKKLKNRFFSGSLP